MTPAEIVAALQAAVDAHDVDAMADCFASGAVLVGTSGYRSGDAGVREYLSAVATTFDELRWHLDAYDMFLSTPDLLGFATQGEVEWRDEDGAERQPFRLTIVAVRESDRWRIQHFHGSLPEA